MSLEDQLGRQLQDAIRTGDATRRDTIRQLRATLHNEAIARGQPLDQQDEIGVVRRLVNQHRDSIAEFTRGNRPDLVSKEQAELEILLGYLPEDMDRAVIEVTVAQVISEVGAAGRKDQGKVMRELATRLKGKADMRTVNEVVQALLHD